MRVAARFAAGNDEVPSVHRSQVTRWESGVTVPTFEIVRRYEILCGIEPGRLVAAIDLVHRDQSPREARPRLRRPLPPCPAEAAEPLLEAALSAEPLTGAGWDELSMLLAEMPETLMPRWQWRALLDRVLAEMNASVGIAYVRRAEAMARICGHRRAPDVVRGLVGDVLSDPDTQVYSEAASLLQYYDHPETAATLLRVLRDPVNANSLRASLFAAATLVRERRLTPGDSVELVRLALDLCQSPDQPYRVRRSAADVLLALTPAARRRIAGELRRHSRDLAVASIVSGDGPMPSAVLQGLRTRMVARLAGSLGGSARDDAQLLGVLDTVTTETNDDRRSHALHLLMVLPVGRAFGDAYVDELESAVADRDLTRVHETLGVLMCLAPGDRLGLLTDLATRSPRVPAFDDEVAVEACWAVGNAMFAPVDVPAVRAKVEAAVAEALSGARPVTPSLLEAWAYVLGRHGAVPAPGQDGSPDGAEPPANEDPGLAEVWRRAIRWWTDLPPHVRAAAREA